MNYLEALVVDIFVIVTPFIALILVAGATGWFLRKTIKRVVKELDTKDEDQTFNDYHHKTSHIPKG